MRLLCVSNATFMRIKNENLRKNRLKHTLVGKIAEF